MPPYYIVSARVSLFKFPVFIGNVNSLERICGRIVNKVRRIVTIYFFARIVGMGSSVSLGY